RWTMRAFCPRSATSNDAKSVIRGALERRSDESQPGPLNQKLCCQHLGVGAYNRGSLMRSINIPLALLPLIVSSSAVAATVSDPTGDFLPSFVGTASPDLDVTSFSVSLDPGATNFTLGAVLAGDISTAVPGFYVIGVNTGHGANAP